MGPARRGVWVLALSLCAMFAMTACGGSGDSRDAQSRAGAAGASNHTPTPAAPLPAQTGIAADSVTLTTAAGSVAVQRVPLRLTFRDANGMTVLASSNQSSLPSQPRLPLPERTPGGGDTPQQPPLYSPFSFVVGARANLQFPATFWVGNLLASAAAGIEYRLEDVQTVTETENGVSLTVSTSDPSGRMATVTVAPDQNGTFRVSVRLQPINQDVAQIAAAFASAPGEAFHGFGGRRNAIDQRGEAFLNWAEELSVTPEQFEALTALPTLGETYQFPTGAQGAYYVQSSFISSADYGFLLERDELSHWRMASDRGDAWQVEVAGPALDFVVATGHSPTAIRKLTGITGRHRMPPEWALGPMLSEAVVSTETVADYNAKVQESLDMIEALDLPVSAFIFEGWVGLQDVGSYEQVVDELRASGIMPVTYYRAWVASEDDPLEAHDAYEEAIANGYVAENVLGQPFLFGSPLVTNGLAALIDFTDPDAVTWWKGRIKDGLDSGSEGFMQDFGEQAFVDMVFDDGSTGLEMHNRYAVAFHRATREAFDEYAAEHPDREPWFFVRNGYTGRPGSAAYEAASWPGDNTADWSRASGIASVIPDMLNRSIGGAYGFVSEIGGYVDLVGRPEKELVIRWAQLASLSPVHRLHGGPVNGTHMPWRYDAETVAEYKRTARRHIAAQPLIMDLWREALATGMPITRPLWLAFPEDPQAAAQEQQFMLGEDILVAPVVTNDATSREVYFPQGCWRHPESGEQHQGPGAATVDAPMDFLPYYFRCGTEPFPVPAGGFVP